MPPPAPNLPFPFRNSRHLLQAALTRPNELFSLFKLFYNNTTLLPISAQAMLKLSATVAPRDESALRIVYSLHLIGTQEIQMLVAQDQAQRGLLFVNGAEHEEHGDLGDKEQDANEQDLSDYEPEKEDDNGDKEDEDGHIKKKKSVSAQKTSAVKRKRTVDKEDDFEVIDDEDTNLYCYCRSRSHGYSKFARSQAAQSSHLHQTSTHTLTSPDSGCVRRSVLRQRVVPPQMRGSQGATGCGRQVVVRGLCEEDEGGRREDEGTQGWTGGEDRRGCW